MSDTVTISRDAYNQLWKDSQQLAHLHALGVDNWEGYSCCGDEDDDDEFERGIIYPPEILD